MRLAHSILCVDDDEANLITLRYILDDTVSVDTTTRPEEALELLETGRYALLITDQRMPAMTGGELCARAKVVAPRTVRFILTAYADLHSTIDAVNRGHVSKYLTKPIRDDVLLRAVSDAMILYDIQESNREMQRALLSDRGASVVRDTEARLASRLAAPLEAIESASEHLRDLSQAMASCSEADIARLSSDARASTETLLGDIVHLRELQRELQSGGARPLTKVSRVDAVVRAAVSLYDCEMSRPPEALFGDSSPALLARLVSVLLQRATECAETVRVECRADASNVFVDVFDDGMLSQEQAQSLFDPGAVILSDGDAHALAFASESAAAAGGSLDATSGDEGTVVTLRLPRVWPR